MNTAKKEIFLFTDGSVNPQQKVGFGAYLLLDSLEFSSSTLEEKIKTKKFENTSSTKLELQTLLWALDELNFVESKVMVFTDCQNIIGLLDRRDSLEKKSYMTSKSKLIKNHELYKLFFKKIDILDCKFIKVKGHKKASVKNEIDDIFTLVDKATRSALRKYLE